MLVWVGIGLGVIAGVGVSLRVSSVTGAVCVILVGGIWDGDGFLTAPQAVANMPHITKAEIRNASLDFIQLS